MDMSCIYPFYELSEFQCTRIVLLSYFFRVLVILFTGNDYYLGFFQNENGGSPYLFLTNNDVQSVQYSIEAPAVSYSTYGTISPSSSKTISLSSGLLTASYSYINRGIYLNTSSTQVTVTGYNYKSGTSDTFLALPNIKRCDVTEYVYFGMSVPAGRYDSAMLVVGTEDNTTMKIRVTQNVYIQVNSYGSKYLYSGTQYSYTINRLQTVYIGSSNDLTGTRVVTDKPVSVFSGHECGYLPSSSYNYCDHLVEQIPPTIYWGNEHYIAPLSGRSTYTMKVLAANDYTVVEMHCDSTKTLHYLNAGKHFTQTHHKYCGIFSNKEVLLAQFSNGYRYDRRAGDPMMTLIPATIHYGNKFNIHTTTSSYNRYITVIVLAQFYQPGKIYLTSGGSNTSLISQSWNKITINNTIKAYVMQRSVSSGHIEIVHTNTLAKPLLTCIVYGFYSSLRAFGHPGGFNLLENFPGTNSLTIINVVWRVFT